MSNFSYINQYAIPIIDSQLLVRKSGGTISIKTTEESWFQYRIEEIKPKR